MGFRDHMGARDLRVTCPLLYNLQIFHQSIVYRETVYMWNVLELYPEKFSPRRCWTWFT